MFLNNPNCVYDIFYNTCDDHMDIILVLKDMVDVKDAFNTCDYFTT